jgi:hypothetical protein
LSFILKLEEEEKELVKLKEEQHALEQKLLEE